MNKNDTLEKAAREIREGTIQISRRLCNLRRMDLVTYESLKVIVPYTLNCWIIHQFNFNRRLLNAHTIEKMP